jgi:hypothetical protein
MRVDSYQMIADVKGVFLMNVMNADFLDIKAFYKVNNLRIFLPKQIYELI